MMRTVLPLLFAAVLVPLASAASALPRSAAERAAFVRENPCPANGARRLPCKGWVIDHVYPLCAGGLDHRSNMQWQTLHDALVKDADERRLCRSLRRTVRLPAE